MRHNKKVEYLILILFLSMNITLSAQENGAKQSSSSPIPTGRRLREIADDKFIYGNVFIGGSSGWKQWGTASQEILDREFGYITPNNDFKQTYIHPEPGLWRWDRADQWVDSAKLSNQVLRMHSPISPQASKWAKNDARTPQELETNMTEYMTELCKHFNGKPEIKWMDVVNETISRDGTWFGPKAGVDKWENPWTIVGTDQTDEGLNPPSYIRMAFEIANQHAPDIKLIYNQHGDMEDVMWDKVKSTVLYLKSLGLRVDGIGWQAHLETDFLDDTNVITKLEALIDWAHDNDLEFHVTENDVDILTGDNEDKQAEVFATVVKAVIEKGVNGVVSWNAWMIRENDGKGKDGLPTLFLDNGTAKPAYYAVQQVLENIAHQATLSTSITGEGSISEVDGIYLRKSEISITATANAGYKFSKWEGDISGTENPITFELDTDKSISAVFVVENESILDIEKPNEFTFIIYPNPVEGSGFNIDLNEHHSIPAYIRIHNQTGQLVYSNSQLTSSTIFIKKTTLWKSGIYYVQLHDGSKVSYSKIIIK